MIEPQVCDYCGGSFGLVRHRWWGSRFCKRSCREQYLRELALDRERLTRWLGLPRKRSRSEVPSASTRTR
jgi:hypothetical protein